MPDATFTTPDLTRFARLDELGLVVLGQRLEPGRPSWLAAYVEVGYEVTEAKSQRDARLPSQRHYGAYESALKRESPSATVVRLGLGLTICLGLTIWGSPPQTLQICLFRWQGQDRSERRRVSPARPCRHKSQRRSSAASSRSGLTWRLYSGLQGTRDRRSERSRRSRSGCRWR